MEMYPNLYRVHEKLLETFHFFLKKQEKQKNYNF